MKKKFEDITRIDSEELYRQVSAYTDELIKEAGDMGMLDDPEADNEYTREIGRVSNLCADYETEYFQSDVIKFKSPLVVSIEKELHKRHLKQRQAAELLDVKESTFSQIMTGRRPVSMQMAKKLYKRLNIDPKVILENA